MSVKSQFLKKLQARQPSPVPAVSKSQADIAAFRMRMAQLQDQIDAWLTDTGLNAEPLTVYVPDLLVYADIPVWTGSCRLCRGDFFFRVQRDFSRTPVHAGGECI